MHHMKFQRELIQNDEWIIDGNYNRTIDIRNIESIISGGRRKTAMKKLIDY
ncbi:hypothetical protein GNF82_21920 [Clostridium perfringens]